MSEFGSGGKEERDGLFRSLLGVMPCSPVATRDATSSGHRGWQRPAWHCRAAAGGVQQRRWRRRRDEQRDDRGEQPAQLDPECRVRRPLDRRRQGLSQGAEHPAQWITGGPNAPRSEGVVVGGQADVGMSSFMETTVRAIIEGAPIKMVGAFFQHSPLALMSTQARPSRRPRTWPASGWAGLLPRAKHRLAVPG